MALSDYQMQLPDGTVVGAFQPVGFTEITGLRGMAPLRSADSDKARGDGVLPGLSVSTSRAVGIKFLIAAPPAGNEAVYAPLAANWQNIKDPSSVVMTCAGYLSQLASGGTLPVSALTVKLPGRSDGLLALGKPAKMGLPVNLSYQFNWWEVDAEWEVPDGLMYDATPNIASALAVQASSGAAFPWRFAVKFPVSNGGTITVLNNGNYPAKPVYKITGPILNPRISNPATGQAIQVNLQLQAGDALVIDVKSRVVRLNGVNRNTALDLGTSFFDIPVGGASLRFSSSDSNPTGALLTAYTLDTYSTV